MKEKNDEKLSANLSEKKVKITRSKFVVEREISLFDEDKAEFLQATFQSVIDGLTQKYYDEVDKQVNEGTPLELAHEIAYDKIEPLIHESVKPKESEGTVRGPRECPRCGGKYNLSKNLNIWICPACGYGMEKWQHKYWEEQQAVIKQHKKEKYRTLTVTDIVYWLLGSDCLTYVFDHRKTHRKAKKIMRLFVKGNLEDMKKHGLIQSYAEDYFQPLFVVYMEEKGVFDKRKFDCWDKWVEASKIIEGT